MRIALVEDDPDVGQLVRLWLEQAGHDCRLFACGADFRNACAAENSDVLILDWTLPDTDGGELIKWVRAHCPRQLPVIFVSARDTEEDIVHGLKLGADDYIPKPVRRAELLARIEAVARRAHVPHEDEHQTLAYPPFRLHLATRSIAVGERNVQLTPKEFDLACFLFRNVGRLLPRDHIFERVWGKSAELNTRTVDTHLSRVRAKLGLTPDNGWRLSVIYNHGYRLERLPDSPV